MIREITGDVACLRWGYHVAASLAAWSITKTEAGGFALSAAIVSYKPVWTSQQPLVFEARHAKGVWRWPILSLQITDGSLSACLGPIEQEHHVLENASAGNSQA